jgi:hypothetical protein
MEYYANVDDAAMNAVLNRQRNTSRNSGTDEAPSREAEDAITESNDGTCG